jgi:PTH1 family peptidyl-tRNA hydrolase
VKVIVGLGNPGREYAATRHNIGFMVVDRLAKRLSTPVSKARFRAQISETVSNGEKVVLVEPQTYMNLSGHSVREVLNWYKCPLEDLIIVADDLDLAFGTLRLRARGSAGGHNGLGSIFEQLGTQEIARLKVGIGRGPGAVIARVLSRFAPEEEAALSDLIDRAADAVLLWQSNGIISAMNEVNGAAKTATAPAKEAAES